MKKYSTCLLALVFVVSVLFSFGGCGKKENNTDTTYPEYEFVHRELPEADYVEPATSFANGLGTEDDPYQIATAAELAYFGNLVNSEETDVEERKAYYKLVDDIRINDGTTADTWSETAPEFSWQPIGMGYHDFEGVFDGDGHTISGIYINVDCPENSATSDAYGLFADNDGIIKNVNLENSYICVSGVTKNIGSIAGRNGKDAVISNCKSDAIIECYDADCGGIVGENNGATIKESEFSGSIKVLKEESFNNIGGIAGVSYGKVLSDCTNNGTITAGVVAVSYAGGIVGRLLDGTVENCVNNGVLKCNEGEISEDDNIEISGSCTGGIAGSVSSSRIGGEEYQNKDIIIENCVNNSEISGGNYAAGIVSSASNMGSKYSVKISNCTNNGKVTSEGKQAGIVADVKCSGQELTIENCKNTADLTGVSVAGIVSRLMPEGGYVNVKKCSNSGNISSTLSDAGGIVSSIYFDGEINTKTTIEKCTNSGKITTTGKAGGVIGTVSGIAKISNSAESIFCIKNCINKGDVYTESNNYYIGGIVGGLGVNGLQTQIKGCINTGSLTVKAEEPSKETVESEVVMELSRMCGGIVGRIGETLYLSTSADKGDSRNVNKENAVITISDCYSNGFFDVPAEDKYKNFKGVNIWNNQLGGIIGNCSATDDQSFKVENCGYANTDRGLGTKEYNDVGTKISAEEINAKIK